MPPVVIILFDLDGTVLTFDGGAPGPGRTAMGRASRELFGEDHTEGVRFAGGTDRAIARTLLERGGMKVDEINIARLLDGYLGHLGVELERRRYRAIGDVAAAVSACHARGACVGLATGNTRRGAAMKLASAGLHDVFTYDRGGYGCDHELRPEVVRIAIDRCVAVAARHEPVVVIGDTRQDVEAARATGSLVVGVALNEATRRELEESGADAIVSACSPEFETALVEAIFKVASAR